MHDIQSETALVAELNDLLQLDHDAIQAYNLAIRSLSVEAYRETLRSFRADHERHVEELTGLIRAHGGVPLQLPHIPTGAFKLAVQAVGAAGGDRAVLLAFKANERQVRDKYRRAAQRPHDPTVTSVLTTAADDEARHYLWALETLEDLGYERDSTTAQVERAFEAAHKGVADAVERAERGAMRVAEGTRRVVSDPRRLGALGVSVVAAGIGFIAARLFARRDRR
jgi:rubrerythrin